MSYIDLSYYAPRFFLNVTTGGEILPLMVMLAERGKSFDSILEKNSDEEVLVIEKSRNEEYSFTLYRDDIFVREIKYLDVLKGHFYVRARPLPPAVFLVEEDRRKNYLNFVKESMVASLIQEGNTPTSDLLEFGVIMTKWGKWNRGYSYFSPLSYNGILKISEFEVNGTSAE
jgi:hypothetical protein